MEVTEPTSWDYFPAVEPEPANNTPPTDWNQFPIAEPPDGGEILAHVMGELDRTERENPALKTARWGHSELTKLAQGMPFLGHGFTTAKNLGTATSAGKIKDGTASLADFTNVAVHLRQQKELAERGVPHQALDTVLSIPGIAQEFLATAGAYNVGKAATSKLLGAGAATATARAVVATVPRVYGMGAFTAANPGLATQHASERTIPEFTQKVSESGMLADVDIGEEKQFSEQLPAGIADAAIELATERAGGHLVGALAKLPGAARIAALKNGVISRWLSKPGRTTAMLDETLKQAGWNGVVGEVLEERLGDVARLATGLESPEQNVTGQLATGHVREALEQLAVEGLAFSVPGALSVASRGLRQPPAEQPSATTSPTPRDTSAAPAQQPPVQSEEIQPQDTSWLDPLPPQAPPAQSKTKVTLPAKDATSTRIDELSKSIPGVELYDEAGNRLNPPSERPSELDWLASGPEEQPQTATPANLPTDLESMRTEYADLYDWLADADINDPEYDAKDVRAQVLAAKIKKAEQSQPLPDPISQAQAEAEKPKKRLFDKVPPKTEQPVGLPPYRRQAADYFPDQAHGWLKDAISRRPSDRNSPAEIADWIMGGFSQGNWRSYAEKQGHTSLEQSVAQVMDEMAGKKSDTVSPFTPAEESTPPGEVTADIPTVTETPKKSLFTKTPPVIPAKPAVNAGESPQVMSPKSTSGTSSESAEKPNDSVESPQPKQPKRGEIGGKLAVGEVVLTSSGRPTTPFPSFNFGTNRKAINSVRNVDAWLLQNAIDEARSRGDDYNLTIFSGESAKNLPQASKDSMEEYLFGEQPAKPPAITALPGATKKLGGLPVGRPVGPRGQTAIPGLEDEAAVMEQRDAEDAKLARTIEDIRMQLGDSVADQAQQKLRGLADKLRKELAESPETGVEQYAEMVAGDITLPKALSRSVNDSREKTLEVLLEEPIADAYAAVVPAMQKAGPWSVGQEVANGNKHGKITGFGIDGGYMVAQVATSEGADKEWDLYDIEKYDAPHEFEETEADSEPVEAAEDEKRHQATLEEARQAVAKEKAEKKDDWSVSRDDVEKAFTEWGGKNIEDWVYSSGRAVKVLDQPDYIEGDVVGKTFLNPLRRARDNAHLLWIGGKLHSFAGYEVTAMEQSLEDVDMETTVKTRKVNDETVVRHVVSWRDEQGNERGQAFQSLGKAKERAKELGKGADVRTEVGMVEGGEVTAADAPEVISFKDGRFILSEKITPQQASAGMEAIRERYKYNRDNEVEALKDQLSGEAIKSGRENEPQSVKDKRELYHKAISEQQDAEAERGRLQSDATRTYERQVKEIASSRGIPKGQAHGSLSTAKQYQPAIEQAKRDARKDPLVVEAERQLEHAKKVYETAKRHASEFKTDLNKATSGGAVPEGSVFVSKSNGASIAIRIGNYDEASGTYEYENGTLASGKFYGHSYGGTGERGITGGMIRDGYGTVEESRALRAVGLQAIQAIEQASEARLKAEAEKQATAEIQKARDSYATEYKRPTVAQVMPLGTMLYATYGDKSVITDARYAIVQEDAPKAMQKRMGIDGVNGGRFSAERPVPIEKAIPMKGKPTQQLQFAGYGVGGEISDHALLTDGESVWKVDAKVYSYLSPEGITFHAPEGERKDGLGAILLAKDKKRIGGIMPIGYEPGNLEALRKAVGDKFHMPDMPKAGKKPKKPAENPVRPERKSPTGEPSQALVATGEPVQPLGSHFAQKVPINLDSESKATRRVSARDIVATMSKDFGIPLKFGRVPKPASGIYKMYSEVVRVRGDEQASLAVESHEIAHHVDKKTEVVSQAVGGIGRPRWMRLIERAEKQAGKKPKPKTLARWAERLEKAGAPAGVVDGVRAGGFEAARKAVSDTLGPVTRDQLDRTAELERLDYFPERGDLQEGFAEFARTWLTTDDAAKVAPKTKAWFENEWMPAHPQFEKAYKHAKELIDQYRGMTAEERATVNKAELGDSPKALDEPFGEQVANYTGSALDKLSFEWTNSLHYLEKLEQEAGDKGLVRDELDNTVDEVAKWADGTTMNHVKAALLGDGIRTIAKGKVKVLAPSLRDIFKPIQTPEEGDAWDNFHVARHVLEVAKINASKNEARKAEGLEPVHYNPGMRYEDAFAIVERAKEDAEQYAKFEKVSVGFSKFRDAILDMRADAGEITQELSDKLKAYYTKHASLRRVHPQSLIDQVFSRKGALNIGGRVQARSVRGSGLPIMPQLDAAIMDLADAYQGAMVHVLKQKILNTVVMNPKLGFRGVEGMGHWAEVVDPNTKPNTFALEEILSQLVKKNVIEKDDAALIRAVDRLRNGRPNGNDIELLETRFGPMELEEYVAATKNVPSLDDLLVTYRPDYRPSEREYIERIMVNGKPVLVEWNPHIYETLRSMGPMPMSAFERGLSGIADLLRLGATGLNMKFGIQQLFSDYGTYLFQAQKAGVAESAYQPLQMGGKIAYSIARDLMGGEKMPSVRMLEENYGTLFEDIRPDQTGIHQLRGKLFAKGMATQLAHEASSPGTYLRSLNNGVRKVGNVMAALDLPARLTEGMAVLNHYGYVEKKDGSGNYHWYNEKTSSFEEPPLEVQRKFLAAVADATVSFRRGGRQGRYINRVILPYFNAWLQGTLRMVKTLRQAARGDQRAIAGLVAGTAATVSMSLLMKLLNSGGDDEQEKEQWYKSSNWSTGDFRIRKPQSWSWIPNTAEAAIESLLGDWGAVRRYAVEEIKQQSYFELPFIDEDPLLGNVAKISAIGPVAEVVSNKDTFRDRKIEGQYLEGLPSSDRYDDRTSELAKGVAKVTGPSLGLGPKKVEHLASRVSGGLITRNPLANPFKPYQTSVSRKELDAKHEELRATRNAAKFHDKPWTDANEAEWDRVDWGNRVVGKLFKSMEGKTEEEKQKLQNYITGTARYALGKAPLNDYPDPLRDYKNAPEEVRELVDEHIVGTARKVLAYRPKGVTAKEKESWLTVEAKVKAWDAERHAAIELIQSSPMEKEAIVSVVQRWMKTEYKDPDTRIDRMLQFRRNTGIWKKLGKNP